MDRATVGDRMVVAGATLGAPVRDGEILEVRGQHGGPPYLVQWSDTGRESLFFPGPDSHVDHLGEDESAKQEVEFSSGVEPAHPAIAGESSAAHVNHWQVDLYLFEDADQTTAQAVLRTPAVSRLDARGAARRSPTDENVPEIGDEVAAARALRRLADRLLGVASDDIAAVEGHPVHLRS